MTESAPLLEDFNEDVPRIGEAHTHVHTKKTPASAYFRPLFKILAITTVVISFVTIVLLIATYIILRKAPVPYSTWSAEKVTKALAILMSAPLVISVINALVIPPILLNIVVDVVLLACIIPRAAELIVETPKPYWCQSYRYPGPPSPPDQRCLHWKLVLTILMGIGAGFALLISVIYVVQLLLRGIAIYRTKLWKTPLSSILPQEIDIHFRMRVLRQEEESAEGSGRGPVYLS